MKDENHLKPLAAKFSQLAHEKILLKAAAQYLSKSEYVRRLILKDIGLESEINQPKTNAGIIIMQAKEEEIKKAVKPVRKKKSGTVLN
ncbi:MAG TPA: hypothetical protein PKE38_13470 [Ignavibacteriaceae bacterium]|nr:hypothetical protein [Ignavibacteriaceae bacterium]